jgi:VIT1/CCC1 family predicted Fe2+/Mn2+ transporter
MKIKNKSELIRSATFGVQDSLVSTVGLMSGVAVGGMDKSMIVMSGIILVLVEAISMGFGELFSAETADEAKNHREANLSKVIPSAWVMFISYCLAGFIPIFPYLVWSKDQAFWWSNIFSVIGLFIYGWFYGRSVRLGSMRHAVKMFLYGVVAISCGVVAGLLLGNR